jgi:hypothetical protein
MRQILRYTAQDWSSRFHPEQSKFEFRRIGHNPTSTLFCDASTKYSFQPSLGGSGDASLSAYGYDTARYVFPQLLNICDFPTLDFLRLGHQSNILGRDVQTKKGTSDGNLMCRHQFDIVYIPRIHDTWQF